MADPTSSTVLFPAIMLGVVATLGYLAGRRGARRVVKARAQTRDEISRALAVAKELESISYRLRRRLSSHVPAVMKFSSRLSKWEGEDQGTWLELCEEAEELLRPVLRLSSDVSSAYSELLQQTNLLSGFAELRTDPLTGVNNRRAFDEALQSQLSQQARYPAPLSLAILDIDSFKQVNDRLGHVRGDRILQDLAQLLRAQVRDCDILARFGGEEFIVAMPHTELHAACNLAERIRCAVQQQLAVTVSIGVATFVGEESAAALLGRADAALYEAKSAGRNCVHVHDGPSGRIVAIRDNRTAPAGADREAGAPELTATNSSTPNVGLSDAAR